MYAAFHGNYIQETYGEDPWLSGHLGTAYVTGIQGGVQYYRNKG